MSALKRKKSKKEVLVQKSAAAIEKDTGAPASENPEDASRRLTNIRPREVSLVDSAANGRTFLLVKRKDAMSIKDKDLLKEDEQKPEEAAEAKPAEGAEAKPAAEGEAAPASEGSEGESKPAAEGESSEGGEGSAESGSEEGAEAEGEEEQVEKHFQTQAEEVLQGVPVAKALAMEQKEMFLAMSDAMMSIAMSLDFIRSDIMAFAGSDGRTGFMGQEIAKDASAAEVEKRGKKMKKSRLAKLKQAAEALNSLIKELDDESETVNKGGSMSTEEKKTDEKVDKTAAAGNAPEGQASEAANQETEKSADNSKPLTQADLDAAVEKAVKPLQEKIEKLEGQPADSAAENGDDTEGEETNKSETETKKSLFSNVIY